ncbi:MAG TPA: hypothetical protein VFZ65_22905 [Planctomycetota bacterium]|nr:hypothetical protein [Planctomycetota bacterium]
MRERLSVDADGTDAPPFELAFVGVDGELPGSPTFQKWQRTYQRFGNLFYQHGSFRIRDLAKAQSNYTLHQFGTQMRINRTVFRIVIFPQVLDKAIWVLDVDAVTSVPLYMAEFDIHMRLLAEVEAESFSPSVALSLAAQSSQQVTVHPDFDSARTFLGDPPGLIDPNIAVVSEYGLARVEVRDDALNGQQKLVMTYTDGLDVFLVAQTPGTTDVFAGLAPQKTSTPGLGNTIARYRDPAMSILLFWDDGVAFQVAGRGSLLRLDELARRIFLQAISTN